MSAVLKDTLVTGVASLEGELDALVLTEVGRGLGSNGVRHFDGCGGCLCVSEGNRQWKSESEE